MLDFVNKIMEHQIIEQMYKSETNEKETNTSKNANALNINEKYLEVLNLSVEIQSKYEDSEISKKKIKKMINRMEVKMNNLFKNFEIASAEIEFDDIVILAIAHFKLGRIYIYKEVNLNVAKDYLMRCIELLKGKEMHYKVILTAIHALIDLHVIWRNLQQLESCYSLLDKALELYLNYTKEDDYPEPFDINTFLHNEDVKRNSKILLIKYHILTLECMETLYCLRPTNMHKFVIYIHNLLNKHLKTIRNSTENYMFIYWAAASAKLSIYFLYSDRLLEAKNHLAAADYMTKMYSTSMMTNQDYSESHENNNKYELVHIFITQLWAIYGIMLLHSSKERRLLQIYKYKSNKSCEINNIKSESHPKLEEELMKPLTFVDLEKNLEIIDKYNITDTYVSNFDDVKVIFANVLRWLDEVYKHYDERNQYMAQVQTILCKSKAYTYYVFFEGNTYKRMKAIKQQIKMLENFISVLSSKHGIIPEYHYHKPLYFELAITCKALLDIKYEEMEEIEEASDEMRMEFKQLVEKIAKNFELFILFTNIQNIKS